ncbi:hypothetical protein [Acidipila rosea]|uniref:hypothetical protein n=1 Tax=Acidipila rosea TaxID=768535 RepID=UPI0010429102|nr:hypothetical protein [Acidipila rosea]
MAQPAAYRTTDVLKVGSSSINVVISGAKPDVSYDMLLAYVGDAARAVSHYYGTFPVDRAQLQIVVVPGRAGVLQGTTWGDRDGFPAVVLLRIGEHTSQDDLRTDWKLTHEFVHTALPSLPDDQHWLEEGIATYVEPIARYQSGFLTKQQVWWGMVDGMPNGEPGNTDLGLDNTHTWGRTYWGGALFCLVADIQIRQQTKNALGLQDALAAIVRAHGSIKDEWPIERVLLVADKRTGTTVLEDLYKSWRATPVKVDLIGLWSQLGISNGPKGVLFDDSAHLADVRDSILHP